MTEVSTEAKTKKKDLSVPVIVDNQAQAQQSDLFSIPELVRNQIILCLDIRTLKRMRLVSKDSLNWVKDSNAVENLKVRVTLANVESLSSSESGFCNFLISSDEIGINGPVLPAFLKNVGNMAKHLEIHVMCKLDEVLNALSSNSNIQTLTLGPVRIFHDNAVDNSQIWMQSLAGLKSFKMDLVTQEDEKATNGPNIFDLMLRCCKKLEYIRMPRAADAQTPEFIHSNLTIPLMNFVTTLEERWRISRIGLQIDFFPVTYNEREYPLTYFVLMELAGLCRRSGSTLKNVSSKALPLLEQVSGSTEILEESLLSVRAHNIGLRGIYVPINAAIDVVAYPRYMSAVNGRNFRLNGNIGSLSMSFVCPQGEEDEPITQSWNPIMLLINETFPSVQEVEILGYEIATIFELLRHSVAETVCQNYANLNKLSISGWAGDRDVHLILVSLNSMTDFKLSDGGRVSDAALVGHRAGEEAQGPVLLRASNLISLEMVGCYLTDMSLVQAIRFSQLKTFILKRNHKMITFMHGVRTLKHGIFSTTAENLQIPAVEDIGNAKLSEFMEDGFRNLKTFKIID